MFLYMLLQLLPILFITGLCFRVCTSVHLSRPHFCEQRAGTQSEATSSSSSDCYVLLCDLLLRCLSTIHNDDINHKHKHNHTSLCEQNSRMTKK